jgi:hypothetical protein
MAINMASSGDAPKLICPSSCPMFDRDSTKIGMASFEEHQIPRCSGISPGTTTVVAASVANQ